jgi:hypothetical protein
VVGRETFARIKLGVSTAKTNHVNSFKFDWIAASILAVGTHDTRM